MSIRLVAALLVVGSLGSLPSALAIDGASPLQFTTNNGWEAFELITQNNTISGIADAGYSAGGTMTRGTFDGIGSYVSGNQLSIMFNHETAPAAISRLDVNIPNLKQMIARQIDNGVTPAPPSIATGIGYAYDSVYVNHHAITNPNPVASGNGGATGVDTWSNSNLNRHCAGTSYLANSFGAGRGFVDQIYITGEEESGGLFYAIDSQNRDLWQVTSTGTGSWENAALVDTGTTSHIAMILSSDVGSPSSDYLRLYVGKKGVDVNSDGSIDFLERNGLSGGQVYFFDPDSPFSASDLPNSTITGLWTTTGTALVDLREDKLEDVHTNPLDGTKVVLADQTDGVYVLDLSFQFSGDTFVLANSGVTISQLKQRVAGDVDAPDNVTWSESGEIFINEDGSGGEIWVINDDGTGLTKIGAGISGREGTGVVDISSIVGYSPGDILLMNVQGSPSQLAVFISPNAQVVPEPSTFALCSLALAGLLRFRRRSV